MAAGSQEIRNWVLAGKNNKNCSHVIIVCDTFGYDDYPVFVMKGESIKKRVAEYTQKNMQRVMEVYSMSGRTDIEAQLAEYRAFHYEYIEPEEKARQAVAKEKKLAKIKEKLERAELKRLKAKYESKSKK